MFIDETWAKTNMTRTHGRCAKGERLVAKAPFGRWRTLTFLAALRCDGLTPRLASSTDRSMAAKLPRLCPSRFSSRSSRQATLSSWTTSGSHKGRAVRAAIRAAKAKALVLARLLARPQSD